VLVCAARMKSTANGTETLTPTERRLVAVCREINERPGLKRLQRWFHDGFGRHWIRICTNNLLEVSDLHHASELHPNRGVIICSNHRSFFDMYVISSMLRCEQIPWVKDMFFPVRSPFFYDSWTGLAVNLAMGGGAMYPPIFRDRAKADLNKRAVEQVVEFLQAPGVVVGMHPEGTRGKGPDPYELLPAQPGVGQMAIQANVPVLPIWISGLSNHLPKQIATNFTKDAAANRIRISFGPPVDLDDLRSQRARATVYKRAADRILEEIRALGLRERERLG